MLEPLLGEYVKGTAYFEVNAEDDVGVASVWIAYVTDPADPARILPEAEWVWEKAVYDPETMTYKGSKDTTPYQDGELSVKVKAIDGTGKQIVSDMMFYVKNRPPSIEVQVPPEPEAGKQRELIAGGVMIGISTDLWGVAPGYPLIQFWAADAAAMDPLDMSAWQAMDKPDPASWNITMNPGDNSKKAMEFRYNAVDHRDPERRPLMPGFYRYRFMAMDAGGEIFLYPPAGSEKDYEELIIVRGDEVPKIEFVRLENNYQREPVYIEAVISHSIGINMIDAFTVQKDGTAEVIDLTYAELTANESTADGKALQRRLKSFEIMSGRIYDQANGGTYQFTDGTYTFTIKAVSNQGSEAEQTYTVYIDTTPPELSVSQVEGAYEATAADAYTVNGVIRISIGNPLEENGLGRAGGPDGPREIKYLITGAPFSAAPTRAELETTYNGVSDYFDAVADTSSPRVFYPAGKYNNIVIDTTSLTDNTAYYLYVIAKDRAGNYGRTGVTLNVAQETDNPRISITAFDINIRNDTDHSSSAVNPNSLNSLTAGRTISGTITDDDGIDPASITFNYGAYDPPTGPFPGSAFNVIASNPKQVTFTAQLPDDATMPDGNYTLEINARDDDSDTTGKNQYLPARDGGSLPAAPFSTTDPSLGRTFFIMDTASPVLYETEIGNDATHFSLGSFDMKGTVQDSNGVRRLTVTQYKDGNPYPDTVNGVIYNRLNDGTGIPTLMFASGPNKGDPNTWELLNLPWKDNAGTHEGADGAYRYEIVATDVSGRITSPMVRKVDVDTTVPKIGMGAWISSPETADISLTNTVVTGTPPVSWVGGNAFMNIKVWDNLNLGSLFYKILPTGSSPPVLTRDNPKEDFINDGFTEYLISRNGLASLELTIPLDPAGPPILGNQGKFTLYAALFDEAGNQINNFTPAYTSPRNPTPAGWAYTPFEFGVDTEAPSSYGELHEKADGSGSQIPTGSAYNSQFGIKGSVADTYKLHSVKVYQKKDGVIYTSPADPVYGDVIFTDVTLSGTSASLDIQNLPRVVGTPGTPQVTLEDGEYTYTVEVQDITMSAAPALPRTTRQTLSVKIDTTVPKMGSGDWSAPGSNKANINLSNAYKNLSTGIQWIGSNSDTLQGTVWDNGTITNLYYKILPATAPVPALTRDSKENDFTINGFTAYPIGRNGAGNIAWNIPVNPGDSWYSGEGIYRIYMALFDEVGNQINNFTSTHTSPTVPTPAGWAYTPFEFGVDIAAPVSHAELRKADGGYAASISSGSAYNSQFGIKGTVEDSNGFDLVNVNSLRVYQIFNGGAQEQISLSLSNAANGWIVTDAKHWELSLEGLPREVGNTAAPQTAANLVSGVYTYRIEVQDMTGSPATYGPLPRTTVQTLELTIDTTIPKLGSGNWSAPNSDKANISLANAYNPGPPAVPWIDSNTYELYGTVWDNGTITNLYYKILLEGDSPPTYTRAEPETTFANAVNGWTAVGLNRPGLNSLNWSATLNPSTGAWYSGEKKYAVYVAVFDEVGNQINNWDTTGPVGLPPTPTTSPALAYAPFVFGVDAAAPTTAAVLNDAANGSGTSLGSEPSINKQFSITGSVADTNELASVMVYQKKDGVTYITSATSDPAYGDIIFTDDTLSGTSASLSIPNLPRVVGTPGTPQSTLADGVYTYTVKVQDVTMSADIVLPRTTIQTLKATVDTQGPVVEITDPDPSAGIGINADYVYIAGTATDNLSAITQIWYAFNTSGTAPAKPIPGTTNPNPSLPALDTWAVVGSGASWNKQAQLSSGNEGPRYLYVVGVDAAGNIGNIEECPFSVDIAPPEVKNFTVSPLSPSGSTGNTYYTNGDGTVSGSYTISFEAYDSNALSDTADTGFKKGLKISRNGTIISYIPSTPELTVTETTPQTTWTAVLMAPVDAVTHAHDGTYEYEIVLTDVANKTYTKTFTVVVDTTPPDVSITREPAVVSNAGMDFATGGIAAVPSYDADPTLRRENNLNGNISFRATGGDDSGYASPDGVKWFLIPKSGSINNSYNPATIADPDTLSLTGVIAQGTADKFPIDISCDTTTLNDKTPYILYIFAKDKTGLVNCAYETYYVDQRTDKPYVTIEGFDTPNPVLPGGKTLTGKVIDDDGVDPASVTVQFSVDAVFTSPINGTVSPSGTGRQVTFTVPIPPKAQLGDVDGLKYLRVNAADLPSAKVSQPVAPAAVWADAVDETFTLDTTRPEITTDDPTDTKYYNNYFTLTGNVTEANPKGTVGTATWFRARLDSNDWTYFTAPAGTGTWSYTVDATTFNSSAPPFSQGAHIITLEATDKVGQVHEVQWKFYKDTVGPVISFSRGEQLTDAIAGNSALWDANISSIFTDSVPVMEGFFVDDWSPVRNDAGYNPVFQYKLDLAVTWTNVNHGDTIAAGGKGEIAGTGKNVGWRIPLLGIADGSHIVRVKVWDELGNERESNWIGFKIAGQPPVITITGPPKPASGYVYTATGADVFTLTGNATDAAIASVSVTLPGGAVLPPFTTVSPAETIAFNYPITDSIFTGLSEGSHEFTIVAAKPGQTSTEKWTFIKDTNAPVNTLSNVADDNSTVFLEANPKIIGSTEDVNGIYSITTVIEKSSDGTPAGTWTAVPDSNSTTPTYSAYPTTVNWAKGLGPTPGTPATLNGGIAPQGDGLYRIRVTSVDIANPGGNTAVTPAAPSPGTMFRIDRTPPVLNIAPAIPVNAYYNDDITVTGTATDLNGITEVKAWLDPGNGTKIPAGGMVVTSTGTPAYSTWSVTFDVSTLGLAPGSYSFNVEAVDGGGRSSAKFAPFTFDNLAPTAQVQSPVTLTHVNGSVTLRGVSNDNFAVAKIEFKAGRVGSGSGDGFVDTLLHTNAPYSQPTGKWEGGLYSWTYEIPTAVPIESQYANKTDSWRVDPDPGNYESGLPKILADQDDTAYNYWLFPFTVRVTDKAGNVVEYLHHLLIDPDMDAPLVEIVSHKNGDLVGGQVRISGIATDDDWVHSVQLRVDPTGTGVEASFYPWIEATLTSTGPSATWYANINDGVYPASPATLNPLPGQQRKVIVQVKARDSKNMGLIPDKDSDLPYEEVTIFFDSQIPVIENIKITWNGAVKDYESGLQVSKTFTVTADIRDESGLSSIKWHPNGGNFSSASNVINSPSYVTPPGTKTGTGGSLLEVGRKYLIIETSSGTTFPGASTHTVGETFKATGTAITGTGKVYEAEGPLANYDEQNFIYRFQADVNTEEAFPGPGDTGSYTGFYSLGIQGIDNSMYQYQVQNTLILQVDNFYPTAVYTAQDTLTDTYYIRGTARDFGTQSGSIQGLSHVTVYFSRDGGGGTRIYQSLDPTGKNHTMAPWTGTSLSVKNMMKVNTPLESVPFPDNVYSGIKIDNNNEITGGFADQDLDGYIEAWYDEGADKVWYATFDSSQLTDGPIRLHYVVFDKAGNAAYYEKDLFIKNNAPKIMGVTLGTDIYGLKTNNGVKDFTVNYIDTGFMARNRYLTFKVEKDKGNGEVRYRIYPATRTLSSPGATAIVSGQIYTIAATGTTTNWVGLGAASNTPGTTFVAGMSAAAGSYGNGTFYSYTQNTDPNTTKSGVFTGPGSATGGQGFAGDPTPVLYSGGDFNNLPDADVSYFVIKAWDTTVADSGTNEAQELFDMIVVGLRMDNIDDTPPRIRLWDLNPLARNEYNNSETTIANAGPAAIGSNERLGGLYITGSGAAKTISGHIEPRGSAANEQSVFLENGIPSKFAKDTISGKVILRGYATDNQRLSGIQLSFNNGTPITIVTVNTATGLLTPATGESWVFNDLTLDGHRAEWAYVWDTQTIPSGAVVMAGTITVRATALDAKVTTYGATPPYTLTPNSSVLVDQAAGTAAYPAANNLEYNRITMNTAPYITSITRNANFNTLRSKQGWFSFRRSATGTGEFAEEVNVNGFNLSTGSGTSMALKAAPVGTATSQNAGRVVFNMPTAAQTGVFTLKVNNIEAVNNRNDNRNTWNIETSPYIEGSELWHDDRNIHVWQSNNTSSGANRGYFAGSSKPIHPAMTKHPISGVLYASWSEYKNSRAYYTPNNTTSASSIYSIYDPPEHTDIHFGMNGGSANASPTVVYNANVYSNGGWTPLSTGMGNSGGVNIWDSNAGSSGYASGGSFYVAETLAHEAMLAQFINERVVTNSNAIHVSYHDTDTKSLKYWYNERGKNVTAAGYRSNETVTFGGVNYGNRRWINIDGGFDGNDYTTAWNAADSRVVGITGAGGTTGGVGDNATTIAASAVNAVDGNRDAASSVAAGEFSAIDLTSQGYPVIAYYDISNQTVKLAYADRAVPLSRTHWKRQSVFPSGDPNTAFSGKYISMKIDTRTGANENRIHMVFSRNSTGNLIYITGVRNNDGSYTFGNSVIIDSVGNVGKWADISLDGSGNLWVSYIDTSRVDSFDGLKMAYCLNPADPANPDAWETMNVPLRYNAIDTRTSIENWDAIGTGTNQQFWSAAIGYASDDYYRIAYYIKP
jgi:hypothetical protein